MKGPRKYERVIWEKGVGAGRKKLKPPFLSPVSSRFILYVRAFSVLRTQPSRSREQISDKVVAYKRLKTMEKLKTITTSVRGRLRYVARVIVYEN